jgi:hypothetical protein
MNEQNYTTDYSQGKIYKIVCNKTGLIYIGSTYRTLDERLKEHEYDCKRYLNKKSNHLISSIYVIYYNNYTIELIENYPCQNRRELEKREFHYISNLDCVNSMRYFHDKNEKHNLYMEIKINKERQELRLKMFKMIMDKYDKKDLEKILLRYGIEEYKLSKKA